VSEYDIYLRHASVRGGEWVGFLLAWRGLHRHDGLPSRPHLYERPWVLDPAFPDDPSKGSWGVRRWQFDIALLEPPIALDWTPPDDSRTPADMRDDLGAFAELPALELKDTDGAVYLVRMTGYREQMVEPATPANPAGGYVAWAEFHETTL
jgi:hypothetical protein